MKTGTENMIVMTSEKDNMLSPRTGKKEVRVEVKAEFPHLAKFLRDNLTEKEIIKLRKIDSQISAVFTEVAESILSSVNSIKEADLTKTISTAKKDLNIFADQLKKFFDKDKISEFDKF
jgi:hypothetical protein